MAITPYVPPAFLSGLPTAIWSGVDGLAVFPFLPGQSITVTKAPTWSTQVIRAASGRERRTAYWPYPLWSFEVQYEVIRHRLPTQDELATLWEFFCVAKGQYGVFLLVDPSDCQIPSSALLNPSTGAALIDPHTGLIEQNPASPYPLSIQFGTGDGATTKFQLNRFINSFSEPVFGVYQPTILDNGAAAGANTVASGAVTFSVAPTAGHTLSWLGYFYYGVRFAQDDLSFEQLVMQLWAGKSLKLTSLRV